MTDFVKYKKKKIEEEVRQMDEITKEIEDIDYEAALRAAGIVPDKGSDIPDSIRKRYDKEQLKRLNELNKKLVVPDFEEFSDELGAKLQDDWDAILKEGKTPTSMR